MLADIGLVALFLAFLLALFSAIIAGYGGWKDRDAFVASGRNAALLTFPFLTISVVILVYSLLSLDFSLAYVANVSSQAMSPLLRVTALWGGQSGSVLFWGWLMSGFIVAVLLRKWDRDRELMPYVVMVAMGTTAFFIGLSVFVTNPFARLWHVEGASQLTTAIFQPSNAMAYVPQDGQGLNPLLRHFGMIGHPPTTYIGFTGFIIPYAFAMAALITGKSSEDEWIRTTRSWTLVAWLFLSIGLVLGGRWAYDVLGWGGLWGWDPMESAMLMPWLTGTAFLHSQLVAGLLCVDRHLQRVLERKPCKDEQSRRKPLHCPGKIDRQESATVWRLRGSPGRDLDRTWFHRGFVLQIRNAWNFRARGEFAHWCVCVAIR